MFVRRLRAIAGLTLALLAAPARTVAGQVGASTDLLTGLITGDQGRPLTDVLVEAQSLETKVTRSTRTDARGRYTILFPDGGGQYRLTVRMIGAVPVQRTIARQTDEDRIVTNITLSSTPQQLAEVTVRGRAGPPNGMTPPAAGATERSLDPDRIARLPIDASDLNLLATLAPGVVNVRGTDSTSQSYSVAGQRPNANAITLDGLSFGSGAIPQDAIRTAQVVTNGYDASRGQFSGGQIATTTRGGTNVLQGTLNYGLRDRGLTISSEQGNPFATGFSQHQLSGGLGGPLRKDKLFVFGSAQARLRGDEVQSLGNAPPNSLVRLGVAPDSARRFTDVVTSLDPGTSADPVAEDRDSDDLSAIGRIDYLVSSAHTLTLRGDYRWNHQAPTRITPLSLGNTGGTASNSAGGGMIALSSRFGAVINELRAYGSSSTRTASSETRLPQGRVQVGSDLPDGSQGITTLTFGGNPGLPQTADTRTVEVAEEVSWLPGQGSHRLKLGLLFNRTRSSEDASFNRYGTFTYNSLADLEGGLPASYTRTVGPTLRDHAATATALYLADNWRVSNQLQLTAGARVERTVLSGAPAYNAAIDAAFDRRTDRWPSELRATPRVGFTWIIGGLDSQSPPTWFVRGGVGLFRSAMPTSLVAAVQAAPGFDDTESQLVCVGAAVPTPDWNRYRGDPGSIPSSCRAGGPTVTTRQPTATVFEPGFEVGRAWRGSLGINRRIGLSMLGVEFSWARGVAQSGYTDLNLGSVRFNLGAEAGRPVFVPAGSIDAATGVTSLFDSRRAAEFGQVLQVDSDLESSTAQVTVSAMGVTRGGTIFNLSYTLARSRDQSSGSQFGGAQRGFAIQTAGVDPNLREWATSDFERRHSFLTTLTVPIGASLEVTAIGRMTSGTPYTPLINSDINGDGAANDRAFVFDAAAADPTVAAGIEALIAGGAGCLARQEGAIARRNSCNGPWQPSLDLQLNIRPALLSRDRRLSVSVVTSNLLGGLDELVHGADGLKGWGQFARPDPTLLYVQGFDPVTSSYRYRVNERFGATTTSAAAIREPFQVGFQLRYTIGPDRQREMMASLRGGGPAAFFSRFESVLPNPAKEVIAIRIALRLEDSQVTRLQAMADSFEQTSRAVADTLRRRIEKAGANPDPGRLMATIRPLLDATRARFASALEAIHRILTETQWAQVPERIRSPRIGPGGPGGPPGSPPIPPPDNPGR